MCVGVVPRVQSNLARTLHAHRAPKGPPKPGQHDNEESYCEAPAGSLKPGQHDNEESHGKDQGSPGKRRHGIWGMPGVLQEDTIEGPLKRETLGKSLGSHDAAERVGVMCHGNGCRQEPTRLNAIHILHKDGMELSHPQSSSPPGTDSIPSREQSLVYR